MMVNEDKNFLTLPEEEEMSKFYPPNRRRIKENIKSKNKDLIMQRDGNDESDDYLFLKKFSG